MGFVVDGGEKVSFPIWMQKDDFERGELPSNGLVATIAMNTHDENEKRWALIYAGPDHYHILDRLSDDVAMPRELYQFSYMPWEKVLPTLAERALKEPWGFQSEDDFGVLKSYITNTYQRVAIQEKEQLIPKRGLRYSTLV